MTGSDPATGAEPTERSTPCAHTDYRRGPAVEDLPATGEGATGVARAVWDALYGVEDPEMPVSVVDLGLIYGVAVDDGRAAVEMTLTYTGCPARELLRGEIREAVAGVDGVDGVDLRLVWNPPWSVELVTDAGKESLRAFGLSV